LARRTSDGRHGIRLGSGILRPGSRTAAFMKLLKPASHLAISERTMEFDGQGKCVAGCGP
jgi:hypothetical protein